MKITRVATLELATRQVKKSQEKSRQSWNFRNKIAEIVARVATLQLFARACDATKKYLANEIKVGMSVYRAQGLLKYAICAAFNLWPKFVTSVATLARRRHDKIWKKSHHWRETKIARAAAALNAIVKFCFRWSRRRRI